MLIVESNPDNYTSRPKVTLPSIQPSPDQVWIIPLFALKGQGPQQAPCRCSPVSHNSNWPQSAGVSFSVCLTHLYFVHLSFPGETQTGYCWGKKVCGHKESPGEVMRAKGRHFRLWWAYASRKQVKVCAWHNTLKIHVFEYLTPNSFSGLMIYFPWAGWVCLAVGK